jgi:hypothetical protein
LTAPPYLSKLSKGDKSQVPIHIKKGINFPMNSAFIHALISLSLDERGKG